MRSLGKTTTRMLALLACALTMAACAPAEPHATPTPTQTAIFASEDEALDAAVAVYKSYKSEYDRITASGEADYASIEELVTPEFLKLLQDDSTLEDKGWHTRGKSTFDNAHIVSIKQTASSTKITFKMCMDVSGLEILDEKNRDVSSENRRFYFPYQIQLSTLHGPKDLRVSGAKAWTGKDFC